MSPISEIHTIENANSLKDASNNTTDLHYCMMFDGCSKGNPGPAGAGAVIYLNNSEIWSRAIYVGSRETNNMAEYTGLLLGLNEAVRRKLRVLTVKGDSEVVIKQMLGKYKVKSENLLDIYNQAKDLEKHFDKIDYIHVYRHLNIRADALSNEGLAKVRAVNV
jgi:ribonuclease HI